MKYVLAVSGGVDSMVMLDIFMHQMNNDKNPYSSGDIIVVHFDHGIRDNSGEDAEFVRRKAKEYNCVFRLGELRLGADISEACARENRYRFLRDVADEFAENDKPAIILTAHHLDDLIETVIINFLRGTGWRGLSAFDTPGLCRPFLESKLLPLSIIHNQYWDKRAILQYAGENNITFREDQSNSSDEYLRNRIRHRMNNTLDKKRLYELWQQEKELKEQIDEILTALLLDTDNVWCRKWFRDLDSNKADRKVALELLRAGTLKAKIPTTRPQLEDFRQAIIKYGPGKYFNLPGDKLVELNKNTFRLP